jgi:hypothetical protein
MKWSLIVLLLASPVLADEDSSLLPPVQIQDSSKALDIEREGHAAPFVGDFYEDGGLCLLVGQFDSGRLRIYRNSGSRTKPRFDSYTWFEAGGKIASVPVG